MMHVSPPAHIGKAPVFDDGRGRYPDRLAASAPIGLRDEVRLAAKASGTTSADFIRTAVVARLRSLREDACGSA